MGRNSTGYSQSSKQTLTCLDELLKLNTDLHVLIFAQAFYLLKTLKASQNSFSGGGRDSTALRYENF